MYIYIYICICHSNLCFEKVIPACVSNRSFELASSRGDALIVAGVARTGHSSWPWPCSGILSSMIWIDSMGSKISPIHHQNDTNASQTNRRHVKTVTNSNISAN